MSWSSAPAIKARASSADSRAEAGAGGVMRSSALPRFVRAHARIGRSSAHSQCTRIPQNRNCFIERFERPHKLTVVPCSCKVMPRFIHATASRLRKSGLLSSSSVWSRARAGRRSAPLPRDSRRAQPGQRIGAIHPSRGEDVTIPGVFVQRQRRRNSIAPSNQRNDSVRLAVVFSLSNAMPRFIHPLAMALRISGGCCSRAA